jgi:hypothetical protein
MVLSAPLVFDPQVFLRIQADTRYICSEAVATQHPMAGCPDSERPANYSGYISDQRDCYCRGSIARHLTRDNGQRACATGCRVAGVIHVIADKQVQATDHEWKCVVPRLFTDRPSEPQTVEISN